MKKKFTLGRLLGIKKNTQIIELNTGERIAKKTLDNKNFPSINGRYYSNVLLEQGGVTMLKVFNSVISTS